MELYDKVGEEGFEEMADYPASIEEVVEGLPAMGEWYNVESQEAFDLIGESLIRDYGLEFEDAKDILETLYKAAKEEFSN